MSRSGLGADPPEGAPRRPPPAAPREPDEVLGPEESRRAPTDDPLRVLRVVAWLLDGAFRVPGTSWRVGLDPIVGVVPFVGDALGGVASLYALVLASRLGAPRTVLARIAANVAIDAAVGAVPGIGDVFDAAFRANERNLALLERWLERPRQTRRASRAFVFAVVALVVLVLAAVAFAAGALVIWAVRRVG